MQPEKSTNTQEAFSIELDEYEEKPYYPLLLRFPEELALKHLQIIERQSMDDEEAHAYLVNILEQRSEAMTTTVISDPLMQEILKGSEEAFFNRVETSIFSSTENFLGVGTTARVKRYDQPTDAGTIPIAIKYVVSPTEKTLSASGEHDVIAEVERLQSIEKALLKDNFDPKYIHVPHPYFHHESERVQCYGMEMVDGIGLEKDIKHTEHKELRASIIDSGILDRPLEEIYSEIERFFHDMHQYCLHGDIKPRNIMVSNGGVFYVIDFGQSVLVSSIEGEKGMDQLRQLQDDEIEQTKLIIKNFLHELRTHTQQAA